MPTTLPTLDDALAAIRRELKAIFDPVLVGYVDDFIAAAEQLRQSQEPALEVDHALILCERSRDIRFRIGSPKLASQSLIQALADLFDAAANLIPEEGPNKKITEFRE